MRLYNKLNAAWSEEKLTYIFLGGSDIQLRLRFSARLVHKWAHSNDSRPLQPNSVVRRSNQSHLPWAKVLE